MRRGKFIVIEGTDCSGKETQALLLEKHMMNNGIPVKLLSFPMYETPTGDIVKRYLGKEPYEEQFGKAAELDPKLSSIFYAYDRFFNKNIIVDTLSNGINVLSNRYMESNMAHQGGKIKSKVERGRFNQWIKDIEYNVFGIPEADLVIFLYMPYQIGMKLKEGRKGKPDGHEASEEHLKHAEKVYKELAKENGWLKVECAPSGKIGSLKTPQQISREVVSLLEPVLDR